MAGKLTPKQEQFCREYMIDLNATQAAIRAGYSKKTAKQIGEQNLSKLVVKNFIKDLLEDRNNNTSVTAKMVIEELAKIAFSDVRELMTVDNALLDIKQMDDKTAAAIASVEVDEMKMDGMVIGNTRKVKLWDKLRALDSLGKHFGIFEKDNSQVKPEGVTIINLGNGVKPSDDEK